MSINEGYSFKNKTTGDVVSVPPPNILGQGVVIFNGRIVERVLYSDENDSVTRADGTMMKPDEWSKFLVECLRTQAWELKA